MLVGRSAIEFIPESYDRPRWAWWIGVLTATIATHLLSYVP